MCGIAGAYGGSPLEHDQLVHQLLQQMTHRGPDAHSATVGDFYVLGHNRLAINDLSPAGEQPFDSSAGTVSCIYNGEIYNHQELRSRFGITTPSSCDGAILPALWERGGVTSLNELRGMYSLAIVDGRARTLTLATDPFGIKPCYWARHQGHVIFASESRPLARLLGDHPLDKHALATFLLSGSIPAQASAHEGIHRVSPGTWVTFGLDGSMSSGSFTPAQTRSSAATNIDIAAGFRESVGAHLMADVPVGLLLSSGVDSLAVAVAAREAGQPLHCLTVDFGGVDGGESPAAAVAAKELKAEHSIVRSDPTPDDLNQFIAAMDRPTVDGLNTFLACQAVRAQGLKVVLSGAGGDEILGGGYRHHRHSWLARASPSLLATASAALVARGSRIAIIPDRAISGFMSVGWPVDNASLVSFARTLRHDATTTKQILGMKPLPRFTDSPISRLGSDSARIDLLKIESEQYLMSQLLPDADSFSMAHSVELRVPFVDVPFAALAWSAPRSNRSKASFAKVFGSSIVERAAGKAKRGFGVPMDSWMRGGPLERLVREAERRESQVDDLVGAAIAKHTIQRWREGRAHWSTAWSIAVLEAWMKRA
jgi:asparagine synthase (glutamine-hydrolysing)